MIPTWTFPDNLMRDPLKQWVQSARDPEVPETHLTSMQLLQAERLGRFDMLDALWDKGDEATWELYFVHCIKDDPGFLQAYVAYWEETERGRQ